MKKTIIVDLNNKDDIFEKYNNQKVSKDLIRYLILSVSRFKRKDMVKVIINNNCEYTGNCIELIKRALLEECSNNDHKFKLNNLKQLFFFIFGAAALGLSTLVKGEVIKEIILIGAWVFLWDMVELEIDDDMSNRKKMRILKKLLASDFVENSR